MEKHIESIKGELPIIFAALEYLLQIGFTDIDSLGKRTNSFMLKFGLTPNSNYIKQRKHFLSLFLKKKN